MAQVSGVSVLPVADRPATERPEAKGADASESPFSGLMAQFLLPPAPPGIVEATPESTERG